MSGSFALLTMAWEKELEKLTEVEERNRTTGYSSLMLLRCASHSCASGDICVQVSILVILEKLPFLFPIHAVGQVTNLSQWAVMRLKIHSAGMIQPSFRAHSKIALLSLLACLLFPDQKQLGEDNVYLAYTCRSQFIKEENQGRNSRQEDGGKTTEEWCLLACSLSPSQVLSQLTFTHSPAPSA